MGPFHFYSNAAFGIFSLAMFAGNSACVMVRSKPCTDGGQSARDPVVQMEGTKHCRQIKDQETGKFVNDGFYYEWYPSDKVSVTGEYFKGKKTGRWIEYDEKGNKTSDKYFKDGVEVRRP